MRSIAASMSESVNVRRLSLCESVSIVFRMMNRDIAGCVPEYGPRESKGSRSKARKDLRYRRHKPRRVLRTFRVNAQLPASGVSHLSAEVQGSRGRKVGTVPAISPVMENNNVPDYVKAKHDLLTLYHSLSIAGKCSSSRLTVEPMHGNDDKPWPHFEYEFRFVVVGNPNRRPFAINYSCGASKEEERRGTPNKDRYPQSAEVLACACAESLEAHENSFEEWAGNFGYDADSRKAEKIYNTCAQQYFQILALMSVERLIKMAELHNQL